MAHLIYANNHASTLIPFGCINSIFLCTLLIQIPVLMSSKCCDCSWLCPLWKFILDTNYSLCKQFTPHTLFRPPPSHLNTYVH